jgi:hypothetical protein
VTTRTTCLVLIFGGIAGCVVSRVFGSEAGSAMSVVASIVGMLGLL